MGTNNNIQCIDVLPIGFFFGEVTTGETTTISGFFCIPMASERSGELVIRSDFWDPNMYQIIQG